MNQLGGIGKKRTIPLGQDHLARHFCHTQSGETLFLTASLAFVQLLETLKVAYADNRSHRHAPAFDKKPLTGVLNSRNNLTNSEVKV
jgi:hypothetical protein